MIVMVLPEKDSYTLDELFSNLTISRRELAKRSGVNKVTVDRIAHKKGIPLGSTINKLLGVMSEVYDRPLNMENVTGIPTAKDTE